MEPSTCVVDNGSYEVRVGFCGDVVPRLIAPNCTARPRQQLRVLVADEIYNIRNLAQLEVTRPLERGILVNAACQRDVWKRCFDIVRCEPRDSKVTVTESVLSPPSVQRAMDEVLFEDFGFLGRCRVPAPVCVAEAAAQLDQDVFHMQNDGLNDVWKQQRCLNEINLVVDFGHTATTVTPVVAGSTIPCAIRRNDIGGQVLTGHLRELISYRQYNMANEGVTLDQLKRRLCFVSQDWKQDIVACEGTTRERGVAGPHYAEYILPDFQTLDHGYARLTRCPMSVFDEVRRRTPMDAMPQFLRLESERFCAPELLFSPQNIGLSQCGVHELIADAILHVDSCLRTPLSQRIIICGGGSQLPGLCNRVERELFSLLPQRVCVMRPSDADHLAFRGAAILAAIPDNYLSKTEWEEYGPDCLYVRP